MDWSLSPGDTAAVPSGRHEILDHLRRVVAAGSDLSSAELIVGELLANAVCHTDGVANICLSWDGPHPLLCVADRGSAAAPLGVADQAGSSGPSDGRGAAGSCGRHVAAAGRLENLCAVQLPEDLLADGGRGLYLVSRLALDVAVTPRPHGGTVVEVLLDLTRPD